MRKIFIGIGSNLGDSQNNIVMACRHLKATEGLWKGCFSKLYETSPVSPFPQPNYLNAVASFWTDMPCINLFKRLQSIEQLLGKIPKDKHLPRPIDLDLLFYGEERLNNDFLQIPHPEWNKRLFVIIPLLDLTSSVVLVTKTEEKKEQIELVTLKDRLQSSSHDFVQLVPLDLNHAVG